jgi:outer membrane protein OmpA-like peptidoglycan-associated protein
MDEKTNVPLDARLKLEAVGEAPVTGQTLKATGLFDFSVKPTAAKEYTLTAERDGYVLKSEKFMIEAAGAVAKTISRTMALAEIKKEPVLLPITLSVKVIDEKTKTPLDVRLKLETFGEPAVTGTTSKTTGQYDFTVKPATSKEYTLTVERDGYTLKSEKFTVEAAAPATKTVTRTITLLEIKKEPVLLPITLSVRVIDEKTKTPLDARLKLETAGETAMAGTTAKPTGQFDFTIKPAVAKEFTITAEREGYTLKSEKFTVEAAGPTAKAITRTITLIEIKKETVLLPITLSVKVTDEKTKAPLDARLKLEATGETAVAGVTPKTTGQFDFSVKPAAAKEYTLTVERDGYTLKSEKFTIEAAGSAAKTVTRTITLVEIKKEPVLVPLKFTVKVLDEKTNLPLDAKVKLETVGQSPVTGTTFKTTGVFDFSVTPNSPKEYTLTTERDGYILKSEKFTLEAAGVAAKTVNRTVLLKPVPETAPLPTAFVRVVVNVYDRKTNRPIEARVILETMSDDMEINAAPKGAGVYEFIVTSTKTTDYELSADREGYVYTTQKIRIEGATDKEKTINRSLTLQPIAVGVTSVLKNLFFDVGKASIRPESYAELNGFRNMMQENPSIRVEISGHTDNVGDDALNKALSQQRANAVKTYLTSKGIDGKRLVAIGYGETRPLVSNDDEDGGREINRRVELKILSK